MKQELEDKLLKDFPLLYSNYNKPPTESLVCYGFEMGDGWFNILYEASAKIEKLIEQYIKENPEARCENCGCDKKNHVKYSVITYPPNIKRLTTNEHCNTIHKIPYYMSRGRLYKNKFLMKLRTFFFIKANNFLIWICDKFNICEKIPCKCTKYVPMYPKAEQMKEKFGQLSIYMNFYTDEISNVLDLLELKSLKVCETCGKPGKLRTKGWYTVRCNKCQKELEMNEY